jgi:hypothetical protein
MNDRSKAIQKRYGDEICEEDYGAFGPQLELSVLSKIPVPSEWHGKTVNNKFIEYKTTEEEEYSVRHNFLTMIFEKLKNLPEIDINQDESIIPAEIISLSKLESKSVYIKIYINISVDRWGSITLSLLEPHLLHTHIHFLDEDDYQCRDEIEAFMKKLMRKLNGFCGTIGLESWVEDIFKIDQLTLNIGDQSNYGIENIYWEIPNKNMIDLTNILQTKIVKINKNFVSYYENIHRVTLPIEVQKIISYQIGDISYKDYEYKTRSPEEWRDFLEFFGFDWKESCFIPLLFLSETDEDDFVCYDPKRKLYFFKEVGLGSESDVYKTIIELLNDRDKIMGMASIDYDPDMNLIHEAIIFATQKHNAAEQPNRKGTEIPYVTHPMEVMQILTANDCSEDVIVAGVLHDTLEDTFTTPEEISEKFGQNILEIVQSESEDKSKTWEERKQATIDHLKTASMETKLVCCADKLANLRSMAKDKATDGDTLWQRFKAPKDRIEWYYKSVYSALHNLTYYPMYKEMDVLIDEVFK